MLLIALLILLTAGCNPPPPETLYIVEGGFTPEQVTTTYDTADMWCDGVGWCPEFVGPGEGAEAYIKVDASQFWNKSTKAGLNNGYRIAINPNIIAGLSDHGFCLVMLHEMGHFGWADRHSSDTNAVMRPELNTKTPCALTQADIDGWQW